MQPGLGDDVLQSASDAFRYSLYSRTEQRAAAGETKNISGQGSVISKINTTEWDQTC